MYVPLHTSRALSLFPSYVSLPSFRDEWTSRLTAPSFYRQTSGFASHLCTEQPSANGKARRWLSLERNWPISVMSVREEGGFRGEREGEKVGLHFLLRWGSARNWLHLLEFIMWSNTALWYNVGSCVKSMEHCIYKNRRRIWKSELKSIFSKWMANENVTTYVTKKHFQIPQTHCTHTRNLSFLLMFLQMYIFKSPTLSIIFLNNIMSLWFPLRNNKCRYCEPK